MKILYLWPRDDDDPPPHPARRQRLPTQPATDVEDASRLVRAQAPAGRRVLPEAA
jgi:hypothetical protein